MPRPPSPGEPALSDTSGARERRGAYRPGVRPSPPRPLLPAATSGGGGSVWPCWKLEPGGALWGGDRVDHRPHKDVAGSDCELGRDGENYSLERFRLKPALPRICRRAGRRRDRPPYRRLGRKCLSAAYLSLDAESVRRPACTVVAAPCQRRSVCSCRRDAGEGPANNVAVGGIRGGLVLEARRTASPHGPCAWRVRDRLR